MELATLFNHNRSMFFDTDDQGRVSFRGKYLAEFEESTYSSRIVGMSLSGFKGKDLSGLADVFPLIKRLTIEKTSNIKSLNGIEKFTNLEELRIEECSKLTDLSAIAGLTILSEINFERFNSSVPIIEYIVKLPLTSLWISGNVTDLELLSKISTFESLNLSGSGCQQTELPILPKDKTSLGIDGFPNLVSAAFLQNQDSSVRIRWWGPKTISNVPAHLLEHEGLKDVSKT